MALSTHIHTDLDLRRNTIKDPCLFIGPTGDYSSVPSGLLLYATDYDAPAYWDGTIGQFVPMSSKFSLLQAGTNRFQLMVVGEGSELSTSSDGVINANRFHGSINAQVQYGGTAKSSYAAKTIMLASGTTIMDEPDSLSFDLSTKRLGIMDKTPLATVHISSGTDLSALLYATPRTLLGVAVANTVEYNGTGWFHTDKFGIRRRFATTGSPLTDFTGTLPISQGGTNATSLLNGGLLTFDGTRVSGFVASTNNEIPVWSDTRWVASSGGYATLAPTSSSRNYIAAQSASTCPLTLAGASGITTDHFAIRNYTNAYVVRVDVSGSIEMIGDRFTFSRNDTVSPLVPSYIRITSDAAISLDNTKIEFTPNNGRGAYILANGGGNTSNSAGGININGGSSTATPGGFFFAYGGSAIGAQAGMFASNGGTSTSASGGICDLSGGSSPGGHLLTSNGGGTVNTTSGFIGLGTSSNRATIRTGGTASLLLPTGTAYLVGATGYASGIAIWLANGVLGATGVVSGGSSALSGLTDVSLTSLASGNYLAYNGTAFVNASGRNDRLRSISATLIGYPIASGDYAETFVPYNGTIEKYTILSSATGSLLVEVQSTGYGAYPDLSKISAALPITLTSDRKSQSSTLTGWNTRIANGSVIKFVASSGNGLVTRATIALDILVDP